jgi:hypothetical protein
MGARSPQAQAYGKDFLDGGGKLSSSFARRYGGQDAAPLLVAATKDALPRQAPMHPSERGG